MARIVLEKVRKEFPDGTVAVNDVSMQIGDGEFMVLVGPSAAASRRCCGSSPGSRISPTGEVVIGDRIVTDIAAQATATSRWCSRTTRSIRT